MRQPVLFIPLFLIALLSLGGCAQRLSRTDFTPVEPESLLVPTWEVDQSWNYRNDEGHWENWTVEGVEVIGGQPAYRVRVVHSRPTFESPDLTFWYDKIHLAQIAYDDGVYRISTACPLLQIFPIANRTYQCEFDFEGYGTYNATFRQIVGTWSRLQTPYAEAYGLEIQSNDLDSDFAFYYHGWYHPPIENFLQYERDGALYRLVKYESRGERESSPQAEVPYGQHFCGGLGKRVVWQDQSLYEDWSNAGEVYVARGSLPMSGSAAAAWAPSSLAALLWDFSAEVNDAGFGMFRLDSDLHLRAEIDARYSQQAIRAGFDSFVLVILNSTENLTGLWDTFWSSKIDESFGTGYVDQNGSPVSRPMYRFDVDLPGPLKGVPALVDRHMSAPPHDQAPGGYSTSSGPWTFVWEVSFKRYLQDGSYPFEVQVDSTGRATFAGDGPELESEQAWMDWMNTSLLDLGLAPPDPDQLRSPC